MRTKTTYPIALSILLLSTGAWAGDAEPGADAAGSVPTIEDAAEVYLEITDGETDPLEVVNDAIERRIVRALEKAVAFEKKASAMLESETGTVASGLTHLEDDVRRLDAQIRHTGAAIEASVAALAGIVGTLPSVLSP